MIKALYTAASGMKAQQRVVDVIANNLSNANTAGFKRSLVTFEDLFYVNLQVPGAEAASGLQIPSGFQVGSGVREVSTVKVFTQGVLEETQNPLDLAIAGDGFFRIQLPDGTFGYTRDGAFSRDSQNQLVTGQGYKLDPAITITPNAQISDVTIGVDGTVSVSDPATRIASTVGQIPIVRFLNPAGLQAIGGNLLVETASSGPPTEGIAGQDGIGTIRKGFLERSNVEVVGELVNLIVAQRSYEINTRAIRVSDEMLSQVNQLVR